MNITTPASAGILHDLHNWSQAARNLYTNASQRHDSPGLRALKQYLGERHAQHLRDLREISHLLGGAGSLASHPYHAHVPGLGLEISRSLASPNRAVVLLACSQVEKQLALAYEQASRDPALSESSARAVVDRHIAELESSQEFVRQIGAEQSRSPHGAASSHLVAS